MDALKSLIQPGQSSGIVDGIKLVVLGGTVETARRVSSSAWSHFVNSFFLTAHFSEDDHPYEWLMLWLNRRPEWQRAREFEATSLVNAAGLSRAADNSFGGDEDEEHNASFGRPKTRVVFRPTSDTTHTIYYCGHWLRVRREKRNDGTGCEVLSISVVARNNSILKQLVLEAKRAYEAEAIHRVQIFFADSHGSWRWTDSRHKRPMSSIVLPPGVKEMLLNDARDFLKSERWYNDRGISYRRGYLLHGVPGSGKTSLVNAIAATLSLDIYVLNLSCISDTVLTSLLGRIPSRSILLLEDLDAVFTRSVSREKNSTGSSAGTNPDDGDLNGIATVPTVSSSRSRRQRDQVPDVNTLSLSGLLNALDGVASAEGRLLFATTNHLERLDPALSRPGRMDVCIEFKHATKWQAEVLFRNFFPVTDEPSEEVEIDLSELEGIDLPTHPSTATPFAPDTPMSSLSSTLWSLSPSFASSTSSLSDTRLHQGKAKTCSALPRFEASNQAYPPPPVEPDSHHSAKPLDSATLSALAKKFAHAIPEDEFSVAALQGYLLKHKSAPEAAADSASVAAWIENERQLREKLKREKEAKEKKDKEVRKKERQAIQARAKAKEKSELEKKEEELEQLRQQLKAMETSLSDTLTSSATTAAAEETISDEPTPLPPAQDDWD